MDNNPTNNEAPRSETPVVSTPNPTNQEATTINSDTVMGVL